MTAPDLRLAARRGFLLLPVAGLGTVTVERGVLRYDPAMTAEVRAPLVARLTREVCCTFARRLGVPLPILLALVLGAGCASDLPAECTPLGTVACPIDLPPQGDGQWAVTCGPVEQHRIIGSGDCVWSAPVPAAGCIEGPEYTYEPAPCPNGSGPPRCVWLPGLRPCD